MRKHTYFISYNFTTSKQNGCGCTVLDFKKPIQGIDDIKLAINFIKEHSENDLLENAELSIVSINKL